VAAAARSKKGVHVTESAIYSSPCGEMELLVRGGRLTRVRLRDPAESGGGAAAGSEVSETMAACLRALERYFAGEELHVASALLDLSGTSAFQRRVFSHLRQVPRGRLVGYGELAGRLGMPGGARAVGQAVGRNPLPIFVPCHRVVAAGGRPGGFGAGPRWKEALLALEGWTLEEGTLVKTPQRKPKVCVYAGSFDPPTQGHMYMVQRGAELFHRLILAVGVNPNKRYTFSLEERLEMLRACARDLPNVEVDSFEGMLLVRYAESVGARYILRGIRSEEDYRFEHPMRNVNEDLAPQITTVFLIPPREICEISSSFVKGLVGFEGWQEVVKPYVPKPVYRRLLASDIRWSERGHGPEGGAD